MSRSFDEFIPEAARESVKAEREAFIARKRAKRRAADLSAAEQLADAQADAALFGFELVVA